MKLWKRLLLYMVSFAFVEIGAALIGGEFDLLKWQTWGFIVSTVIGLSIAIGIGYFDGINENEKEKK